MTENELHNYFNKPRESEIFVFVGAKQCGKTTEVLRLNKTKTVFIVSYSPKDRGLSKYRTINAENIDCANIKQGSVIVVNTNRRDKTIYDTLYDMGERVFNSCIILDDTNAAVGSNPGLAMRQAIGSCRHNCNDVFLTYWNINQAPPFVYEMCDYIGLFKTSYTGIGKALDKVPRRDEIERAYDWIQSESAPNYSYAYLFMHPMHPMSRRPFIKFIPKGKSKT
jgi:hypothetical protein